jgi:otoferlin
MMKFSSIFFFWLFFKGLLRDGRVTIEDHLVDSGNRPITATVNFEVRYSSPENMEGNFDSQTVSKYVQQQSLDDDQQMLLNIEQNIANLEKSLTQGGFQFTSQ